MLAPNRRCAATTRAALSPESRGVLERAPLTRGLSTAQLDRLGEQLQEQSFLPGHRIVTEGFRGQEFFVIVSGVASVAVEGWQIARLGPGEFFGEIGVLDGGVRFATITAVTPLRCLVLANADLDSVLVDQPLLALNLLREMVRRFRDTIGKGRGSEPAASGGRLAVG